MCSLLIQEEVLCRLISTKNQNIYIYVSISYIYVTKIGNMVKKKTHQKKNKNEHSPTLKTIKMVEDTLKNMDDSIMKISELKRNLPKKINHITLKKIINYLEESNKIVTSHKGITWIVNNSPKLKRAIEKGTDWEVLSKIIRKRLGKDFKD